MRTEFGSARSRTDSQLIAAGVGRIGELVQLRIDALHRDNRREPELDQTVAGRYRLERLLARGGMGEVFAAIDQSTGARIALKRLLITENKQGKRSPVVNFMREYHALTELRHPRIIGVFDYGVDRQRPYYTMELLDGHDLRELSPVPYREACGYLRDVASSLALLHARRLLHRDVTPRNVRRTSDGRCKLLDFGAMVPFGVPPNLTGTPSFIRLQRTAATRAPVCCASCRRLSKTWRGAGHC